MDLATQYMDEYDYLISNPSVCNQPPSSKLIILHMKESHGLHEVEQMLVQHLPRQFGPQPLISSNVLHVHNYIVVLLINNLFHQPYKYEL